MDITTLSARMIRLSRIFIGGIFAVSGLLKIADIPAFVRSIDSFEFLPSFIQTPTAIAISALETICGSLMVAAIRHRAAARILTVLSFLFTLLIATSLGRGIYVPCGCFGSLSRDMLGPETLARDILLTGILWILARTP